ncbi:MAG TPA: hypothetical protein DGG95_16795 [Cytophagales bacterium]|jgi:competence protein ComEC|nr:hypothetical protein [Cytophagales bacterium]
MKWQPFPMLRIALFFTGGVLLGIYQPDVVSFQTAILFLAAFLISFFISRFIFKSSEFYNGLFGLLAIFLLGYARLILSTDSRNENHLSKIKDEITVYEGIVRSVPEEKANSWKIEVSLLDVKTETWQPVTGNLLLYISKKGNPKTNWEYGDRILVHGSPQELKPPANPGEFDFKRFLSFKNILHQQFVQANDVQLIHPSTDKGFIYYSHQARAWCMDKLNAFVHGENERAIAIALVLGVTDGIDNDLQNAYAASGAMHVLAVSGMHVGIIYAIILFLFKPIDKKRNGKWVIAIVSLFCLWVFSFVTGNSPSVLRAVTMFSFIAVARPFGKRTNIYNTLAASVLVLLIYNPYLIMSVGFQLSYLAVLGIVYLQRPIYQLWEIGNYAGDWIWKITCISFAAQASTFALGLLYFHQFPSYFLVSNLFVIPLSTIVLLGGIFLLTISFISPLANLVGVALEFFIKILNGIVFTTESLPLSLINNIHITIFQCWLLMAILLALVLLFEFKSIRWLYIAFSCTFLFSLIQWMHFTNEVDQKQMIVYSINKHSAIEFIDHGQSYFLADSSLIKDRERIRFHILPNRLIHGVSSTSYTIPFSTKVNDFNCFQWNNSSLAYVDKPNSHIPENLYLDYLVIGSDALSKNQISKLKVRHVIFDGSNSMRYVDKMVALLSLMNISTHAVLKDRAFVK